MKHKSSKQPPSLKERIEKTCKGLVYVSETDAPIEVFFNSSMDVPIVKELLSFRGKEDEPTTTSTETGNFFKRLTTEKEWHTEVQSRNARRFKKLQQLLEKELEDIRIIRVGRVRIEIYVIGKSKNGEVAGIKTFSVET